MKKVTAGHRPTTGSRRLGVATAKARLSEALRGLDESPVVIHNRGRDVAVLVDMDTYARIAAGEEPRAGGAAFLDAVDALRQRFGPGVDDFAPAPARFDAKEAFPRRR